MVLWQGVGGWIPGRKAAGDLQRLRPVGQTGLRVEVVLSFPTAPLRRDRGKSPRKPIFSELRTPRKLCLRHNFRPPARSRRNARTTNNPAEVCPAGRSLPWRRPCSAPPPPTLSSGYPNRLPPPRPFGSKTIIRCAD